MEGTKRIPRAAWLIGGALLVGAAFGLSRLLAFELDFDPWDDAIHY